MSNQPSWLEVAEEMLQCNCKFNYGTHSVLCSVTLRPAVAKALQDAFEAGQKSKVRQSPEDWTPVVLPASRNY